MLLAFNFVRLLLTSVSIFLMAANAKFAFWLKRLF